MDIQVRTFGIFLVTGIVLAFLFDVYRVLRGTMRMRFVITSLADLIYWLIATAIIFLALLLGNWGEFRLYIFIALMVGATFYFKVLSKFILSILFGGLHFTSICLRKSKLFVEKVVVQPLFFIIRVIAKPLFYIVYMLIRVRKGLFPPK